MINPVWRLTTPRRLRRWTLALLVAWLVTAVSYQHGDLSPTDSGELPAVIDTPG